MLKSDFKDEALIPMIVQKLEVYPDSEIRCFIADAVFGANQHPWDEPSKRWKKEDFEALFAFAS